MSVNRSREKDGDCKGSFQIGERVHLKSGGPVLTVVDFDDNNIVVSWAMDDGTVEERKFLHQMVRRALPRTTGSARQ